MNNELKGKPNSNYYSIILGYYSALLTSILVLITFILAITAVPKSGTFCQESTCVKYPYTDILTYFPNDYYWMIVAIFFLLTYIILMTCINQLVSNERKIFSQIGYTFAILSSFILLLDYFIQLSVIQPSLLNNETNGISILTQYNPHGLFISFEVFGYLLMGVSFLFYGFTFDSHKRLEQVIKWILIVSSILVFIFYIILNLIYGTNIEYIYEIVSITICWFTLIIIGVLLSQFFKKQRFPSTN